MLRMGKGAQQLATVSDALTSTMPPTECNRRVRDRIQKAYGTNAIPATHQPHITPITEGTMTPTEFPDKSAAAAAVTAYIVKEEGSNAGAAANMPLDMHSMTSNEFERVALYFELTALYSHHSVSAESSARVALIM